MTNTLPDTEVFTRNLAAQRLRAAEAPRSTTYHSSPARIRAAETVILDLRTGEPYGVALPMVVPLDNLLQEPPTGPVPPPPMPAPESLMKPGREPEYFSPERKRGTTGTRRAPFPRWGDWFIGAGLATIAWSACLAVALLAANR